MSIKVKICGITNGADAQEAIKAGASYLGVIFATNSSRRVEIDGARQIQAAVAGTCPIVGVFLDAPLSEVLTTVKEVGLDLVQLHGNEPPEFCAALPVPVVKVFTLDFSKNSNVGSMVKKYRDSCKFVMFDKPKGSIDPEWLNHAVAALTKAETAMPPYFFAGGLTSSNVFHVASRLRPYCIDVSSGVESKIRHKDAKAMKEFCEAVAGTTAGAIQQRLGG
jgi:phosphoribosylanthranilate isomerase